MAQQPLRATYPRTITQAAEWGRKRKQEEKQPKQNRVALFRHRPSCNRQWAANEYPILGKTLTASLPVMIILQKTEWLEIHTTLMKNTVINLSWWSWWNRRTDVRNPCWCWGFNGKAWWYSKCFLFSNKSHEKTETSYHCCPKTIKNTSVSHNVALGQSHIHRHAAINNHNQ